MAIEIDLASGDIARGRIDQVEDGGRANTLARPALAENGKRLAVVDIVAYAVDRADWEMSRSMLKS